MSKRSAQLLGVGILILGVVAALPFRRQAQSPLVAPQASRPDLQLQQADASPDKSLADATAVAKRPPPRPTPPGKLTPIAQSETAGNSLSSAAGFGRADLPKAVPTLPERYKPSLSPMVPSRPPAPLTADEKPRRHLLVDGDSLPDLAERYLGSRNRFSEILQANPQLDPDLLPLRSEINIPPRIPRVAPSRQPRTKLVPVN